MDEQTCENCFWYKHQYEIHGYCRNPRNATVGSAGSDYSSSELLKPMSAKIFQVCDLHEVAGAASNLRNVYEVEAVPRDWREVSKAPYRTEWRRKTNPTPHGLENERMDETRKFKDWRDQSQDDLEMAIAEFKAALPGWWYSVCECQVSCDASCAPTVESEHINLITEAGDPFDSGFHADLRQPSSLAEALRNVLGQALAEIEARALSRPTPEHKEE